MKESIVCTVVGQTHTNDTLGDFSTNVDGYVGKSGNYYYTYVQKFEVPQFYGKAEILAFQLVLSSAYSSGHTLRAAVVSSLENLTRYIKSREPLGEVEDACQIASQQLPAFENVTGYPKAYTFSMDGSRIRPGTYYLILWVSTAVGMVIQSTVSSYGNATVTLTVEKGIIRLDDGTGIQTGIVYVDRGTALCHAVAYLDTGSAWVVPC